MENKKGSWISKSVIISIVILVLLLISMVLMGIKGLVGTVVYPIVIGSFLLVYWVVTDVLDIKWENRFEGKTPSQIRAYYSYAMFDFIGLAGLVYFLTEMRSMTGVLIYIFGTFMKRKYNDEFKGITDEDDEEEVIAEPSEPSVEQKEIAEDSEKEDSEQE